MRIINDYNLKNLKEVKLSKLGNVKIGDFLNAKIVEVSDNKVIADIKGKLVLLNNLLNLDLVEGEILELEVASQKNGKVYARPTNITFKEELNIELLSHELKNLDLTVTDKHIKVLNFFKENNILFNKTELKEVLDNIKFIEKLIDHIEKGNVDLKTLDINNNLREELVKIITSNLSGEMSKTYENIPKETVDVLEVLLKGLKIEEKNEKSLSVEKKATSFEFEKFNGEKDASNIIKDKIESNQKNSEVTMTKEIESTLMEQLKGFELDAILFLVKEKFNINLSNLLLSNNFFTEVKNIGESLDKIVDLFENQNSVKPEALESLFKEVLSMKNLDTNKIDLFIEELFNKSHKDITPKEREAFKGIQEELVFIRKTNDFNLELNQKINYYQFSLQNNNRFSDVEFFVNKESHQRKNNKKKFKVFVSLQTRNLERVKAIVELKKKKNLSITFITKTEKIEKKLEKNINQLKIVIENIGFDQVNINFMQQREHSFKKELLLDMMSSKIDMRV